MSRFDTTMTSNLESSMRTSEPLNSPNLEPLIDGSQHCDDILSNASINIEPLNDKSKPLRAKDEPLLYRLLTDFYTIRLIFIQYCAFLTLTSIGATGAQAPMVIQGNKKKARNQEDLRSRKKNKWYSRGHLSPLVTSGRIKDYKK